MGGGRGTGGAASPAAACCACNRWRGGGKVGRGGGGEGKGWRGRLEGMRGGGAWVRRGEDGQARVVRARTPCAPPPPPAASTQQPRRGPAAEKNDARRAVAGPPHRRRQPARPPPTHTPHALLPALPARTFSSRSAETGVLFEKGPPPPCATRPDALPGPAARGPTRALVGGSRAAGRGNVRLAGWWG